MASPALCRAVLRSAVTLAVGLGHCGSMWAAGPPDAGRSADHGPLLWFVQVSDSHVTAGGDDDTLATAVRAALVEMNAAFVVHTGDLVDQRGRRSRLSGSQQCDSDEWSRYRSLLGTLADPARYIDLPGNHEEYSGTALSCYLGWSVAGRADSATQHVWTREVPPGGSVFVGMATCGGTTAVWPEYRPELTDRELDFLEAALTRHRDASVAFVFGHHPLTGTSALQGAARERFLSLLRRFRVAAYGHGHNHRAETRYDGELLVSSVGPLIRAGRRNLALYTVDGTVVRVGHHDVGRWPVVQITSPADAELGGHNPFALPIASSPASIPVRAVAFDPGGLTGLDLRADGGVWHPMVRSHDHVWQGAWDHSRSTAGRHVLEVRAAGASGSRTDTIAVKLKDS